MNHELIVVIVNRGFADIVMTGAKEVGARGGTIVSARGTGTDEVKKLLGITVNPSKEIVLILSEKNSRDMIMSAICKTAGLNTPGRGIVFSVPVDNVLGITAIDTDKKQANPDKEKTVNEQKTLSDASNKNDEESTSEAKQANSAQEKR